MLALDDRAEYVAVKATERVISAPISICVTTMPSSEAATATASGLPAPAGSGASVMGSPLVSWRGRESADLVEGRGGRATRAGVGGRRLDRDPRQPPVESARQPPGVPSEQC